MMQSFKLDPASTNTHVAMTDASTLLDYTVDFEQLQPTLVPAGQAAINVDWSSMSVNALGYEFKPIKITDVRVARYDETPVQLEARFLDLETLAKETFTGPVLEGTALSLDTLTNSAGQHFGGITAAGTWVLALECGECRNPAPWYMTVLKPCE
jgi:hypothetical protein